LHNDGNGASKKNTKNLALAPTKSKKIAGLKGSYLNLFFKKHLYQYGSSLAQQEQTIFRRQHWMKLRKS